MRMSIMTNDLAHTARKYAAGWDHRCRQTFHYCTCSKNGSARRLSEGGSNKEFQNRNEMITKGRVVHEVGIAFTAISLRLRLSDTGSHNPRACKDLGIALQRVPFRCTPPEFLISTENRRPRQTPEGFGRANGRRHSRSMQCEPAINRVRIESRRSLAGPPPGASHLLQTRRSTFIIIR